LASTAWLISTRFIPTNGMISVQLCAFDVLAVDGEDVRDLPLAMRKVNLERVLRGRPDGIFINPFEVGRHWA
jgi:ATP-dependent DNA ligase